MKTTLLLLPTTADKPPLRMPLQITLPILDFNNIILNLIPVMVLLYILGWAGCPLKKISEIINIHTESMELMNEKDIIQSVMIKIPV